MGVVANQPKYFAGCLDIDGSDKAARFSASLRRIQYPDSRAGRCSGFLPGTEQEHGGIIRHGAKLLYAFCEATVPKVSVILRKAYGGAYIAMNSKETGADFVFAWPTAEIAVMGADGQPISCWSKSGRQRILRRLNSRRSRNTTKDFPTRTEPQKWDMDDVIDPASTRQKVAAAFGMMAAKRESRPKKKHGNIPL